METRNTLHLITNLTLIQDNNLITFDNCAQPKFKDEKVDKNMAAKAWTLKSHSSIIIIKII